MSLGHLPPRLSDAEALALGRLIEPELHAALLDEIDSLRVVR